MTRLYRLAALSTSTRGQAPTGIRWTSWELDLVGGTPVSFGIPARFAQYRVTLLGNPGAEPVVRAPRLVGLNEPAAYTAFQQATPVAPTFRIHATRLGMVGGRTANGHRITKRDRFVALPSRRSLSSNGGNEYMVQITYNGRTSVAPVYDIGPWNINDNYWDEHRDRYDDLPRGWPEDHAAFFDGYNGGRAEKGRVSFPTAMDVGDGLWWDDLGINGDRAIVEVTFLWLGSDPAAAPPAPAPTAAPPPEPAPAEAAPAPEAPAAPAEQPPEAAPAPEAPVEQPPEAAPAPEGPVEQPFAEVAPAPEPPVEQPPEAAPAPEAPPAEVPAEAIPAPEAPAEPPPAEAPPTEAAPAPEPPAEQPPAEPLPTPSATSEAPSSEPAPPPDAVAAPPPTEIVVDNHDPAFKAEEATWYRGPEGCGSAGQALWTYTTPNQADSENVARWQPALPTEMLYDVYVNIPACESRARATGSARYLVHHLDGVQEVIIDQAAAGTWVLLGRFPFAAGEAGFIELRDIAGDSMHTLWYDAVKWVPVPG